MWLILLVTFISFLISLIHGLRKTEDQKNGDKKREGKWEAEWEAALEKEKQEKNPDQSQ